LINREFAIVFLIITLINAVNTGSYDNPAFFHYQNILLSSLLPVSPCIISSINRNCACLADHRYVRTSIDQPACPTIQILDIHRYWIAEWNPCCKLLL